MRSKVAILLSIMICSLDERENGKAFGEISDPVILGLKECNGSDRQIEWA